MRSIRLGIAIVIAGGVGLCSLLLATLWVSAQTIPPDIATPAAGPPVSVAQVTPSIRLTATVGTTPGVCATSDTIQVRANTTVYYCFTLNYTGSVALTKHEVSSTLRRFTDSLALDLTPGALTDTVAGGRVFTDVPRVDIMPNTITWTARSADSSLVITATDRVTIDIIGPAVSVVKTVGQDRNTCARSTVLRIPTSQGAVYCLTLRNEGDAPLVRHTVSDPLVGLNSSFVYTLAPGADLEILPDTPGIPGAPFLAKPSVLFSSTNVVTVTSTTANGLQASDSASARLEVGSTTVQFSKTVGTDPNACPTTPSIRAAPGSQLFYCVTVRNTSPSITLTHHSLVEDALSINLNFDYPLPPSSVLTVTKDFLAANNLPAVFGPFEFSARFPAVVNNRMNYTGTSPIGDRVTANASTLARFVDTPTPTPTKRPTPIDTPTFIPTWTPSITPIPPTPTETPTPTFTPVTPTPTPTRSYAISLLETPTPSQPQLPPTPFVDPAFLAVTLTAQAATATAAAAPFGSPLGPPFLSPLETPTPDSSFFVPSPEQTQPAPQSPLELPTLPPTPTPALAFGDTPTPALVVVIVTNTPGAEATAPQPGQLPPGQRPVVPPTPTPTPDYVMFAATMLDSFLLTAGWIWFFAGSLIFFVSAGIVAGLFFRQQERRRFDLIAGDLEDGALVAPAPPAPEDVRPADIPDDWPDSLP